MVRALLRWAHDVSDIVSLDAYRQRRELERLLRASLGQCGSCGRQVMEHSRSERMICWSVLTFNDKGG